MREIAKSLWKRLRIDAIDPMLIHTAGRRTAEFRGIRPERDLDEDGDCRLAA